eukprot:2803987-Pleurochrysis_carterae.AAC.3
MEHQLHRPPFCLIGGNSLSGQLSLRLCDFSFGIHAGKKLATSRVLQFTVVPTQGIASIFRLAPEKTVPCSGALVFATLQPRHIAAAAVTVGSSCVSPHRARRPSRSSRHSARRAVLHAEVVVLPRHQDLSSIKSVPNRIPFDNADGITG